MIFSAKTPEVSSIAAKDKHNRQEICETVEGNLKKIGFVCFHGPCVYVINPCLQCNTLLK